LSEQVLKRLIGLNNIEWSLPQDCPITAPVSSEAFSPTVHGLATIGHPSAIHPPSIRHHLLETW